MVADVNRLCKTISPRAKKTAAAEIILRWTTGAQQRWKDGCHGLFACAGNTHTAAPGTGKLRLPVEANSFTKWLPVSLWENLSRFPCFVERRFPALAIRAYIQRLPVFAVRLLASL